jgi:aminomethyltransferase
MTTGDRNKTPLDLWHRGNEATMVDFGGWEMPLHYRPGILQEHLATRKFAGLFDVSHMGRFRIKGDNRVGFLQHVLSNNAEALAPWEAQYTLIPNASGGVIDDGYLCRFGRDDYLLVVNAANRGQDWIHLCEQAEQFGGVWLEDHTEEVAVVALQGPLSGQILAGLIEAGTLPEPFRNRLSEVTLCGTNVLVARGGYTGEPVGFELFVPADQAEPIWSRLHEVGKGLGALPVGLGARDTLRLEAGLPLHGREFGIDPDGREFPALGFPMVRVAVSFSERKGDYIGREALARQFRQVQKLRAGLYEPSEILPRRIRPLALLDQGVARHEDEVFVGQDKVGVVTSGTMTPYWQFEGEGARSRITDRRFRRAIALAYVEAALRPGTEVEVVVRGRRLRAQLVRWHGRSEAPPYFRPIPVGWQKPQREPAVAEGIATAKLLLKRTLDNHQWRQNRSINLIPSEMTPSPLVRLVQVSDPVGRYAEHKELLAAFEQEVYYYQGTDFIAWVEDRLAAEMAHYLGCPLVELRTVSGQMANMTVFSALVDYRNRTDRRREPDRIRMAMNNQLAKGGHLSSQPMGALRDYLAKDAVSERYAVLNFPVCADNPYRIDVDRTAELLDQANPELILFGKSMVLHPEPVAEIRRLVQGNPQRPIIMYDMAHVLGLVGPHFQEPFVEGADVVTGSTHKTFFGTQRGVIGARFIENTPQFDLWRAIRRRTFPGMVSNHHLGSLVGLLLAAVEMNTFKDQYQPQVIANAKAFARALKEHGLAVEGDPAVDFTETHQVIVNVGYGNGCRIAQHLEESNIVVNYQAIPGDEGFTASSGLRLGVAEMTRFGMKENDFRALASLFADAVNLGKNLADEVAAFRQRFLTMQYCFDGETLEPLKKKLLETF